MVKLVCKTGLAVLGTTPTTPGTAATCLIVAVSETLPLTVTLTLKFFTGSTDLNLRSLQVIVVGELV
jgi:hypothetical protein